METDDGVLPSGSGLAIVAYCLTQLSSKTIALGMDKLRVGLTSLSPLQKQLSHLLYFLMLRSQGKYSIAETYMSDMERINTGAVQAIRKHITDSILSDTAIKKLNFALTVKYDPYELLYECSDNQIYQLPGDRRFKDLRDRIKHYRHLVLSVQKPFCILEYDPKNYWQLYEKLFQIFVNIIPEEAIPSSSLVVVAPDIISFSLELHVKQLLKSSNHPEMVLRTHRMISRMKIASSEILLQSNEHQRAWQLLGKLAISHGCHLQDTLTYLKFDPKERVYTVILMTRTFLRLASEIPEGYKATQVQRLIELYESEGSAIDIEEWRKEGTLGLFFIYHGLLIMESAFSKKTNHHENHILDCYVLVELVRKLIVGVVNLQLDDWFSQEIYKLIQTIFLMHGGFSFKLILAFRKFMAYAKDDSSFVFPIIRDISLIPSYISPILDQAENILLDLHSVLIREDVYDMFDDLTCMRALSLKPHSLRLKGSVWSLHQHGHLSDEDVLFYSHLSDEIIMYWFDAYKASRGLPSKSIMELIKRIGIEINE
jgi:hypothetical protein